MGWLWFTGGDLYSRLETLRQNDLLILRKLDTVLTREEKIMAAGDDLKAAVADLATELNTNNLEIEALLTKITAPGTSDADVEAAVATIRQLISDNSAEVNKAQQATGNPVAPPVTPPESFRK
jgi:chromosome segregation ATPase